MKAGLSSLHGCTTVDESQTLLLVRSGIGIGLPRSTLFALPSQINFGLLTVSHFENQHYLRACTSLHLGLEFYYILLYPILLCYILF